MAIHSRQALIPGTCSRPADIYLPNWRRGQPAALDVTVISTLQRLTLHGAATIQGHTLSVGKERKMTAHFESCRSVGVIFLPLVVELLRGWDGEAADIIRAIGRVHPPPLPTAGYLPLEEQCCPLDWTPPYTTPQDPYRAHNSFVLLYYTVCFRPDHLKEGEQRGYSYKQMLSKRGIDFRCMQSCPFFSFVYGFIILANLNKNLCSILGSFLPDILGYKQSKDIIL